MRFMGAYGLSQPTETEMLMRVTQELVYVTQIGGPFLARQALEIYDKSLHLMTAEIESNGTTKPHLAAIFVSYGRFQNGNMLCCAPWRFAEADIEPPRWALGTPYQVALNGEYNNRRLFEQSNLMARFEAVLRKAHRAHLRRMKRENQTIQ
jgi:hypothetical protein